MESGGSTTTGLDISALTSTLSVDAFEGVIEDVLPLIGVAVLTGFVFYAVRWAIGLFRGV